MIHKEGSNLTIKMVCIILALAIMAMLATAGFYFWKNKDSSNFAGQKERGNMSSSSATSTTAPSGMGGNSPMGSAEKGGSMGMSMKPEEMEALGELMAEHKKNPTDLQVILKIADIFVAADEWALADGFLKKAISLDSKNTDAYYMLGITQYNLDKPADAAKSFETLLSIQEDPRAQFSLALLYKHALNRVEEGNALIKTVINSPKSDAELKEKAKAELNQK